MNTRAGAEPQQQCQPEQPTLCATPAARGDASGPNSGFDSRDGCQFECKVCNRVCFDGDCARDDCGFARPSIKPALIAPKLIVPEGWETLYRYTLTVRVDDDGSIHLDPQEKWQFEPVDRRAALGE